MSKGLNVTEPHSATAASTRCFPLNNPLEEKQGDRDNQREQGPGQDARGSIYNNLLPGPVGCYANVSFRKR